MKIPTDTFLDVFDKTIEHFRQEYLKKEGMLPNLSQIFKLSGYDKSRPHLGTLVSENLDCISQINEYNKGKKEHEKFIYNSRYIYDKKKRLDAKIQQGGTYPDSIKLNAPYDKLLFLFLGFKSFDEYEKAQNDDAINYRGFYYSYKTHSICDYELSINYKKKPAFKNVPYQEFSIEQQGFHDHKKNPKYTGYGYVLEGKLQLMMWEKEGGDRLRILLDSGENPESVNILRGAILAVTSFSGKPLSALETVVIKLEEDLPPKPRDILRIKRYLMLHRYNFRIRSDQLSINRMIAKRIEADAIENFVGVWQVFRYDHEEKKILSSLIYVKEDYRITCFNDNYTRDNLKEQVCLPNITTNYTEFGNALTLCVECYPKEGAQILSTMMIQVPVNKITNITGGVITFVGGGDGFPSMSAIVLKKDEELSLEVAENENPDEIVRNNAKNMKSLNEFLEIAPGSYSRVRKGLFEILEPIFKIDLNNTFGKDFIESQKRSPLI